MRIYGCREPTTLRFGAGFFALGGDFTGDLTEDFFATPPGRDGLLLRGGGAGGDASGDAERDTAGGRLLGRGRLGAALGVVAFFAGVTAFGRGSSRQLVAFFAGGFAGVAAFLAGARLLGGGLGRGRRLRARDLGAAQPSLRNLSLRSLLLRAFSADLNSASARMVAQAPSRSRERARRGTEDGVRYRARVGCRRTDGAASGAGRGGRSRARRSSRGFDPLPFATRRRVESRRSAGRRGNIDGGATHRCRASSRPR